MAKNLTTLFLYRQYAGLTSDTPATDLQLTRMINQVSQAIAAYCDRTFELTTYRSWLDGTGRDFLTLPQWPVTRLLGVSTGTIDVGEIKNTSAKWASVSLKDATFYLDAVDTSGAETNDSVAISAAATIADLATAVIALGNGWTMTSTTGETTQPTILVRPFDGVWAVDPDTVDLELADETEAARLVESSHQMIEYPSGAAFPCGSRNVFVWYKAGYTLPVDNTNHTKLDTDGDVPEDLTLIANEILAAVDNAAGEEFTGAASEKIGNYSYTLGEGAQAVIKQAVMDHAAALSPHRSSRVI